MPSDISPLTFGTFFHIYNRGNNGENVFIQERNYAYFMDLWWKHISPIMETWAYCLLRNHFHIVGFVKYKEDLIPNLTGLQGSLVNRGARVDSDLNPLDSQEDLSGFKIKPPHQYFSNFFNAYARGVNLATQRTGTLFKRPFKRIPVTNDSYLMRLIVYIHQNPQKHKFTTDFRDWNYSSYHEHITDSPTRLQRDKIIQLFGSRADFIRIHQEIQPLEGFEAD